MRLSPMECGGARAPGAGAKHSATSLLPQAGFVAVLAAASCGGRRAVHGAVRWRLLVRRGQAVRRGQGWGTGHPGDGVCFGVR